MNSPDLDSQWREFHLAKMFQAISVALVIYDYALNIDREVCLFECSVQGCSLADLYGGQVVLVWRQRFTPKSALFFVNRYIGGATIIASFARFVHAPQAFSVSSSFVPFQAWMTAFSLWTMQGLLQFRCHAFNHFRNGRVVAMCLAFAAEVAAMIVMLGIISSTHGEDTVIPGPMCSPTDISRYLYTFTVPVIPFECFLITLSFWGGLQHIREMRDALNDWTPSTRMIIPMRDALIHFVITCTSYSIAGAIWFHHPLMFEIPLSVVLTANIIIGSRMFLNLRHLTHRYHPEDLPERVTPNYPPSPLTFASHAEDNVIEMESLPPLLFDSQPSYLSHGKE
ncbi:hypothetical protein HYDPIDRAFT_35724 [Hydnomerulius pinastri MD-312]|nr:hypothetical protein HYDPIDRAFT_35724 [Hydnomerulius pinastri MD-312]